MKEMNRKIKYMNNFFFFSGTLNQAANQGNKEETRQKKEKQTTK